MTAIKNISNNHELACEIVYNVIMSNTELSKFLQYSFSPYRDNLGEEITEVIAEDIDLVCESVHDRGLQFFFILFIGMFITLFKVILLIFTQLRKPKYPYEQVALTNENINNRETEYLLTVREARSVANKDNYTPDTKKKNERADKVNKLRKYLYQNNLQLKGYILTTVNHRLSDEEVMEVYNGNENAKAMTTTYVTFGYDIDYLLKEVLQDKIDLRVKKLTGETSIKIINYDFRSIGELLSEFYNEDIEVKFDDTKKD